MSDAADLELLQRHEPILQFTRGELFYPMAASAYVGQCDLLEGPTLRDARIVVPAGSLDLGSLAAAASHTPGQAQFLRFVPKPLARSSSPGGATAPARSRSTRPGGSLGSG